jgi:hypothetical protein
VCVCVTSSSLAFHFPRSPSKPRHKLGSQDSPDTDPLKLEEGRQAQALGSFFLVPHDLSSVAGNWSFCFHTEAVRQ